MMPPDPPEIDSVGDTPTAFGDEHRYSLGRGASGWPPGQREDARRAFSQEPVSLRRHEIVLERFEVLGELRAGPSGAAYRVRDLRLGKQRALRLVPFSWFESDADRQRFLGEVRAAQQLSHNQIASLYELMEDAGRGVYLLTMELVEGKTLDRFRRDKGGRLPPGDAFRIARQICEALCYAHKHVRHCALQPSEIVVLDNGGIKVLNVGLVSACPSHSGAGPSGSNVAHYRAPEANTSHRRIDKRADVFTVGVILYEMLTGALPIGRSEPPSSMARGISKVVDAVVYKCLTPQPDDRYGSAEELLRALDRHASCRPAPWSVGAVAAVAAVILLGLIGAAFLYTRANERAPLPPRTRANEYHDEDRPAPPVETRAEDPGAATQETIPAQAPGPAVEAVPERTPPQEAVQEVTPAPVSIEENRTARPPASENVRPGEVRVFADIPFVWIPPGEFMMGSELPSVPDGVLPEDKDALPEDERPRRWVALPRGFWLGQFEVKNSEFERFVSATGYVTEAEIEGWGFVYQADSWEKREGIMWRNPGFEISADHPAVLVSWNDAQAFVRWLSGQGADQFRLPTEAEWEYACRAGASTLYPWGDNPADGAGWCNAADGTAKMALETEQFFLWSDGYVRTAPVGRFRNNPWGAYDMIGNVWEWCQDWYSPYPAYGETNPVGPLTGAGRVRRGGSWLNGPMSCRPAFRGWSDETVRRPTIGFRVVRERDED